MIVVGLALAAALGGVVRFRLTVFGWPGTLMANMAGSFLLGVLIGWRPDTDLVIVMGTGFCGALTTFSTFALEASVDTVRPRIVIIVSMTVGSLVAAVLGHALV